MTPRDLFVSLFGRPYRRKAARVLGCAEQTIANLAHGSAPLTYRHLRTLRVYGENRRRSRATYLAQAIERVKREEAERHREVAEAMTALAAMIADHDRNGPQRPARG
jgi:hypothetical protein